MKDNLNDNIILYFKQYNCLIERQNLYILLEFLHIDGFFDNNDTELLWDLLTNFNKEKQYITQSDCERIFKRISLHAVKLNNNDSNDLNTSLVDYPSEIVKDALENIMKEITFLNSNKSQRRIAEVYNNTSLRTLIQLKKIFQLLDISFKQYIHINEINILLKFSFVTLTFNDVLGFILTFALNVNSFLTSNNEIMCYDEIIETKIQIDSDLLKIALSTIDNKLIEEEYNHNQDYLLEQEVKQNSNEKTVENNNQLSLNINQLLKIQKHIQFSNEYSSITSSIFNSIMYLINNTVKVNLEKLNDELIKESFTSSLISIERKSTEFDFFLKEVEKVFSYNNYLITHLRQDLKRSEEQYKDLESDFEALFNQMNQNKNDLFVEEVQGLIDENNYLKDLVKNSNDEYYNLKLQINSNEEKYLLLQEELSKTIKDKLNLVELNKELNEKLDQSQKDYDSVYYKLLEYQCNNEIDNNINRTNKKLHTHKIMPSMTKNINDIKDIRESKANKENEEIIKGLIEKLEESEKKNKLLVNNNINLEMKVNEMKVDLELNNVKRSSNILANVFSRASILNISRNSINMNVSKLDFNSSNTIHANANEVSRTSNMNNIRFNKIIEEEDEDIILSNRKTTEIKNDSIKGEDKEKLKTSSKFSIDFENITINPTIRNSKEDKEVVLKKSAFQEKLLSKITETLYFGGNQPFEKNLERIEETKEESSPFKPIKIIEQEDIVPITSYSAPEVHEVSEIPIIPIKNTEENIGIMKTISMSEQKSSMRNTESQQISTKLLNFEKINKLKVSFNLKENNKPFDPKTDPQLISKNSKFNISIDNIISNKTNKDKHIKSQSTFNKEMLNLNIDKLVAHETSEINVTEKHKIYHLRAESEMPSYVKLDNLNKTFCSSNATHFCYDSLNLRSNHKIQIILENNLEEVSSYEMYSSIGYIWYNSICVDSQLIFITSNSIYILRTDDIKVNMRIKLNNLHKITLSTKNNNLLCLHFKNNMDDILIELLNRTYLIGYLRDLPKMKRLDNISIVFSDNFKYRGNQKYKNINSIDHSYYSSNFENAIKIGLLEQFITGIFSASFDERLIVLTDIGILLFEKPNKITSTFISLVDSTIYNIDEKKFNRRCIFEIKTTSDCYIFSARDEMDREDWISKIKLIQTRHMERIKSLLI